MKRGMPECVEGRRLCRAIIFEYDVKLTWKLHYHCESCHRATLVTKRKQLLVHRDSHVDPANPLFTGTDNLLHAVFIHRESRPSVHCRNDGLPKRVVAARHMAQTRRGMNTARL
jgi:hypothetical protein